MTQPIGIFLVADAYLNAAVQLVRGGRGEPHEEKPIRFCYFHAMELYLKAYLAAKDVTLAELKKMRHGMAALLERAVKQGLVADDLTMAICEYASLQNPDDPSTPSPMMQERYLTTGVKEGYVPDQELDRACRQIRNAAIGPFTNPRPRPILPSPFAEDPDAPF